MDDIEPFLRAIFADPADDLPRLVFADWLDEHAQSQWAAAIRLGCDRAGLPDGHPGLIGTAAEYAELLAGLPHAGPDRGFHPVGAIELPAHDLRDAAAFRRVALTKCPHWYGARTLKVTADRITDPAPLVTILTSPVTERVTDLDLRGQVVDIPLDTATEFGDVEPGTVLPMYDTEQRPVIAVRMVEVLAQTREARRLTRLDLRNNDLDNDALRALARSPYLHQLTRLDLLEGNRFKGRHWQQILETYGQDVVQ